MTITVDRTPGVVLVRLAGDVDVTTVPELRLTLHALTGPTARHVVVIDLADVTFLDATGLGVLVGAHRRAQRAGTWLELRNPTERVRRLLAITRLDRVLRITTVLEGVA